MQRTRLVHARRRRIQLRMRRWLGWKGLQHSSRNCVRRRHWQRWRWDNKINCTSISLFSIYSGCCCCCYCCGEKYRGKCFPFFFFVQLSQSTIYTRCPDVLMFIIFAERVISQSRFIFFFFLYLCGHFNHVMWTINRLCFLLLLLLLLFIIFFQRTKESFPIVSSSDSNQSCSINRSAFLFEEEVIRLSHLYYNYVYIHFFFFKIPNLSTNDMHFKLSSRKLIRCVY